MTAELNSYIINIVASIQSVFRLGDTCTTALTDVVNDIQANDIGKCIPNAVEKHSTLLVMMFYVQFSIFGLV